ncbi:outer membrane beta-barrel protein [Flavobacterium sp. Fl-77]|uniref:Outer membrane beta-barrel protein n=1 Tax=Flavobacterium flavipigmentatum TaxID=2893884 RepID=A0AAJ2SGK3_9FLAO|nr:MULTISPECIES: outer membrane beta-barrel protein [unclassified Flavobacterium]MDX6183131.1 outer membrane beta-barrel protein [Flavobacterium sp. Fl-33]MDX6186800.1 outer membrane beta-barrel protein [Flavobacterium sp. Fl-77]UFH40454.1 outer membrane beta-barrel protein [Flavobacterium sp. F-70]
MTKLYFCVSFCLILCSAHAQNEIVIKGTVLDINTQLPLELATVYFTTVKDSTVIEYATTDKNGAFRITTKKYDKPLFLKINYMGYQPYFEEQKQLLESKDFGKIYLLENVNALAGVVIKSEAPPITIKKDTLEFNAASYKVRPDSNVETLLKQLPGFDIDDQGKVTVNGREVTQFLVNGKTFFDKDGAIALKNLPAEIIKKIQVSDFKTKKEELSKQESTSDYSSINITIDEKKNKGYFGKMLAGYGSDDRYESSLIMNFFNNKQKISVLGSSNNINATGFSMDEVFDNMSGGRNTKNDTKNSGSGKGITQSNLLGLNYSDDWTKDLLAMGSYNFSNTITKNDSKSNQVSFLPTGNIVNNSDVGSRNENTGNNANFELEYKIDPKTTLLFSPKINESRSNNMSLSSSFSEDENGDALNESSSKSYREGKNSSFSNSINFNKAFEKKARNFSLVFLNSNSKNDTDGFNFSQTIFYQDNKPNDERNQNVKNRNISDSYTLDLEYTEPITDSLRIRFGSDFDWSNEIKDQKTFNFDDATQSYSDLNASLTNYMISQQNAVSPKVGISWQKSKFTFNLNSKTSIIDFENHSLYLNNVTDLNKKYALPFWNAQIRYKFSRSKFLTFKYDYSTSLPTSEQLMPVLDLTNPLNTITGNPNLNPIEKNSANFNFRKFDFRTRSGYSVYVRGDYYTNDVISTSIYDDSGKRTTTYANISGVYSASVGGNWNQSLKREAHVLRYGLAISANYSFDKGFTNAVLYTAQSIAIVPKAYFTYEYGDLLTISPSYSLSYNETKYQNYTRDASSNVMHRINLQTTTYWPENLIFGNDFGYTFNSSISSDFKKDFYLWNTSLSYGFFDKKIFLKVKVYDVLNQNQSATRTISATSIRDEENTVLKRYMMFSLAYKIGNFAGTEKGRKRKQREE